MTATDKSTPSSSKTRKLILWWTPEGQRVLQGAEGRAFREALGMIVKMVRDDTEGLWKFGAPPFDNLQPSQKLALLREDRPMPRLTAAYGTVGQAIELPDLWDALPMNCPRGHSGTNLRGKRR